MQNRLLNGIQKVASRHAAPSLGRYLNDVMDKSAETEDAQTVTEKVKSNNTTPSSASSKGMEERNKGYGHTAVDTDYDKKTGGEETGETQVRGDDLTTEGSGIPDKSLKTAATQKLATQLRASRIRERLQKHASALGLR